MKSFLKFLFSLTILFSSISVLDAQPVNWQKVFGGIGVFQTGYCGIQAFDGDYIILNQVIGGSNSGTCLLDMDQFGNQRWFKNIDFDGETKSMEQTIDSGFIFCGGWDVGNLVKVDRAGNLVWSKHYTENENFLKVKVLDSNEFLVCGYTAAFDAFVMKTDSIGDVIWQSFIDVGNSSSAEDVTINNDGYIYLTGGIDLKTLIVKLTNKGEIKWINSYGPGGALNYQYGQSIVPDSNRELFISGYCRDSYDGHFTKIDSAGNFIFQRVIQETSSAADMVRTSNGNYAIAGVGTNWKIFSEDFLFLLVNNKGDIIYKKLYNSFGEESDYSNSIVETSDKGFLITGSTTYKPLNSLGSNSTFIVRTDSTGYAPVSIKNLSNETPASFELYQNYPNPFNPVTNLEFGISKLGFVSLKVFDVLGNEVKTLVNETKTAGNYEVKFDGSNLPSGVYFYKLSAGDFTDVKRMVLLK